jgi:methylated-DNA-[protein]-cysteine S-methyltransferase
MNPNWTAQSRTDTPLGPMTLVATAQGLAGAWFDGQKHHPGDITVPVAPEQRYLQQASHELQAYFAAKHHTGFVFKVPLDPQGTAFQRAVWQALLAIGPGTMQSYGHIAQQVGRPTAARAVGAAVGRNPISIIVPCHRVVGSGGALTGYAGGLARKQALLDRESLVARSAAGTVKLIQPRLAFDA